MCGIWGYFPIVSTGFTQMDIGKIMQMMILTQLRGMHSTGIAVTNMKKPNQKPRTWKTVGGPDFLICTQQWTDIDKYLFEDGGFSFGHGRYATKGNISAKNAHPFSYKHITLVHNGTITEGLDYKVDGKELEVDSHALCAAMANDGIKETLDKITGAFAVIVHDATDGSIYMARNLDRPLHYYESASAIMVMSQREDFNCFLSRNAHQGTPVMMEDHKIYKLVPGAKALQKVGEVERNYARVKYQYPMGGYYGESYYEDYGGYKGTKSVYKKEDVYVEFEVTGYSAEGREYLYVGETRTAKSAVSFRTSVLREDLVGKVGYGKVAYDIYKDGKMSYFVKYRDISWKGEQSTEEKLTCYNNRILDKQEWLGILKKHDCCMCGNPVGEMDWKETIVRSDDTLVCGYCVDQVQTMDRV